MKILILEPFYTGSHQQWIEGYQRVSQHQVQVMTLPGRHWKWRMIGGAPRLARRYRESGWQSDLILASDMLDVATFLGLARVDPRYTKVALYFHENQITYPWSPGDLPRDHERNNLYGYTNFTSALAADALLFNSRFHLDSFLEQLPLFLGQFPDHQEIAQVESLRQKAHVLPLGLDLKPLDTFRSKDGPSNSPVILWNHRWEYDKNPDDFFGLLFRLKDAGYDFRLIVLGKAYAQSPAIFEQARSRLSDRILHWGYARNREEYARLLWQADLLPVTAIQDFFGGSVIEAIYCGCYPLLPNRLAYPEHLPKSMAPHCLYGNNHELGARMQALLTHPPGLRAVVKLRDFVSKYDWSNLNLKYDRTFRKLTMMH